MQNLNVTLIQTELAWEDKASNLNHFERQLNEVGETDLILLPEMFTTGFSMQPKKLAEPMNGESVNWLINQAEKSMAVITGSLIIEDEGKYFNRLIWAKPDGTIEYYDKRHLFSMAGEQNYYSAGSKRLLVELKGWKICPQVCYDLRFPVWNRNDIAYDLLFFVANWPAKRNIAWKTLLQARAIENQTYVAGLNRVGNDGNMIYHSGDSTLIDPLGEIIYNQADMAFIKTIELSKARLNFVREKYPFLPDKDQFYIND